MYGRWGLPCARRSGRVMCVAAREYLPAGLAIAVRACQPVCVCRALERWLERAGETCAWTMGLLMWLRGSVKASVAARLRAGPVLPDVCGGCICGPRSVAAPRVRRGPVGPVVGHRLRQGRAKRPPLTRFWLSNSYRFMHKDPLKNLQNLVRDGVFECYNSYQYKGYLHRKAVLTWLLTIA